MNKGAVDCIHHKGIKSTKSRKCCGGKEVEVVRIECDVVRIAMAGSSCVAQVCPLYEKKKSDE